MTYFIKTTEKDLKELVDDFLFTGGGGSAHIEQVLGGALQGQGFGFDFYGLFFKGDDWDTETESYYFPTPIDNKHALIETNAYVDDQVNDSEIGYIPLEMLYNSFANVVEIKSKDSNTTQDIPKLEKMLAELKKKWQIK